MQQLGDKRIGAVQLVFEALVGDGVDLRRAAGGARRRHAFRIFDQRHFAEQGACLQGVEDGLLIAHLAQISIVPDLTIWA